MADIRAAAITADIADRPATVGRVPLRVTAVGAPRATVVAGMRRVVVAVTHLAVAATPAEVVDIPVAAVAATPAVVGTVRV